MYSKFSILLILVLSFVFSSCVTNVPLTISPKEQVKLNSILINFEDIYPKSDNNDLFAIAGKVASGVVTAIDIMDGKVPEQFLVSESFLNGTYDAIKTRFPLDLVNIKRPNRVNQLNDYFFPIKVFIDDEAPSAIPNWLDVTYNVSFERTGFQMSLFVGPLDNYTIEALPVIEIVLQIKDKENLVRWNFTSKYRASKSIKIGKSFIFGIPLETESSKLETLQGHLDLAWEQAKAKFEGKI